MTAKSTKLKQQLAALRNISSETPNILRVLSDFWWTHTSSKKRSTPAPISHPDLVAVMNAHSRAVARISSHAVSAAAKRSSPHRRLATLIDPIQKVGGLWTFRRLAELTSIQDPTELDQITTLPNGIRVATESLPGPFSGIGVYIDAGSRFEDEELRGVSHIVDRLAFKVRLCDRRSGNTDRYVNLVD